MAARREGGWLEKRGAKEEVCARQGQDYWGQGVLAGEEDTNGKGEEELGQDYLTLPLDPG